MSTDPRVSFANKLIKLGIESSLANLIAVEAGGSQAIVNKKYLKELGIVGKFQNKVFIQVLKFYMGEFSDFVDE